MKKILKSIMACSFMLMSSVMSAEVVTYDFTTPGEDGTIYGFTLPTDKSKPTYVTNVPMVNGVCTLTMTDSSDSYGIKPRIQTTGEFTFLQLQQSAIFNFTAERNITKIEFTKWGNNDFIGWVPNVGKITENIWEGSDREIVISNVDGQPCYITKITITLESSDTYTVVASATELA